MAQEDDLSQLSDLLVAHVEAVNSGDVEALLDQLTDDVVYLGQGMDPIVGKAQMEPMMRSFHAENRASFSLFPQTVPSSVTWRTNGGRLPESSGVRTGVIRFE